ncbi:transferase family-domain-containing protein [Staphylotrichum tortipilum]|uniref:Transferase family-domain-containing protein n=1 Tax=Staphylotrichum tortipilum TaxID=2831512 RepID=A0AAN6MDY0_9PEZI|nr:transferase family-domain-containing protein [Staphylotrichum longicolle]
MAASSGVERLPPLDAIIAWRYSSFLFLFRTTQPVSALVGRFQHGLDRLCEQLPWLSGNLHSTGDTSLGLKLRWNTNERRPAVVDRGSIPLAYEALATDGFPPSSIPDHVWPTLLAFDSLPPGAGLPVLELTVFGFGDNQGVGLCFCKHHSVMDAPGVDQLLRIWAKCISDVPTISKDPTPAFSPRVWMPDALSTEINATSALHLNALLTLHPEFYTTDPVPQLTTLPVAATKMIHLPLSRLNSLKSRVAKHMQVRHTTNTLLTAVLWSAITRARLQHTPSLATSPTLLLTVANGRRHLPVSAPPYFGNLLSFCGAELPISAVTATGGGESSFDAALAAVCDAVAASTARSRASWRPWAEMHSLVDKVGGYCRLRLRHDPFTGRGFLVTSWANLGMYGVDFGAGLGRPEAVRVRATGADGLCFVMPRRRSEAGEEVLEVLLGLTSETFDALEEDKMWRWLVG